MKILITGGAGFIASNIADRYISEGHQVIIVDNLSTGHKKYLPREARFYEMSISSPELSALIEKETPDIVNHHAAQISVRQSISDPIGDAQTNILGSLNLLEACRNAKVGKVIFASTGGVIYGEQDYFPADENHKTNPRCPYGIAKLAVEKYLQFYHWTCDIPCVVLRYGNVYGPRQNPHGEAGVIAIFIERLLKGEVPVIFGDGQQTRDYIYIDDVTSCNVKALRPDVQGIFNVGTGVETTVNQIVAELMPLIGGSIQPQTMPSKMGELRRSCIRPGALQKDQPIKLLEGLKKTATWFKAHGTR